MKNLLDLNLAEWDLQKVQLQSNILIAAQRPTTQEDNFGQIIDRMDLYHIPNNLLNGIMCDMKDGKENSSASAYKCALLVKYEDGSFAIFFNQIRVDLSKSDIKFI